MSKRIMVVDDSRLVRVQLGDVLEGTDYEIVAYCRSGEDAIAQYDEVKPDLVTMDIIMQGMDGLDAYFKRASGRKDRDDFLSGV